MKGPERRRVEGAHSPEPCQAPGTLLKEPQRVPYGGYGARTAKGGAS
jgi:hypothetical protein